MNDYDCWCSRRCSRANSDRRYTRKLSEQRSVVVLEQLSCHAFTCTHVLLFGRTALQRWIRRLRFSRCSCSPSKRQRSALHDVALRFIQFECAIAEACKLVTWPSKNCCDRRTRFVVIWKHFCLILFTGSRIRIDPVMHPRSSSRGRNTSASVTVTVTGS